jgi:hypothetical protein
MTQPIGFFTSLDPLGGTPAALHLLDKKFGSYLQRINRCEKLALLAIISHCLAANAHPDTEDFVFTLEDAWAELDYNISPELGGMLEALNTLRDGDLLGICQTLIENHSHTEVAA